MLNGIFLFLVVSAVSYGAFAGTMEAVSAAGINAAKAAVTLAIGLIGQMALWLGFMRVLRDAGIVRDLSRLLTPVARRLFPDIPDDHPATAAMIMNVAANMLGLANAATPFGLKAMKELEKINKTPGVATDSMALFLAINTSGVAVLPLGVIAVRAQMGATNIAGIIIPSMLATACSTMVAIIACKLIAPMPFFRAEKYTVESSDEDDDKAEEIAGLERAEEIVQEGTGESSRARSLLFYGFVAVIGYAAIRHISGRPDDMAVFEAIKGVLAHWLLPVLMAVIVLLGFTRRVRVYESLVEGAKEGFDIGVLIIPYLVAILVCVGMFRASGLLGELVGLVDPVTSLIGLPAEALPMAMVRPLSGSGALGVMTEIMGTHGPDSFIGFLVSVMSGSTETTFYVLALYLGSVSVRISRYTVIPCLAADFTGAMAALFFSRLFF